jgi:thiol-disulfide isomerase/thioredoxin
MNKKIIVMALIAILLLLGMYLYKKFNVAPSINFEALELYDLDTNRVTFKNLKGKKLIVSFGASWCPNCIDELNTLKKIKDTQLKEVEIICISDEDFEVIKYWKEKKQYPFTFLKLNSGFNSVGVYSIPTTYIFDTKLQLKLQEVGFIDWEDVDVAKSMVELME